MELKKSAALAVVLMLLLTISTFAETKINQLNRFPLMELSKKIESVKELKDLLNEKKNAERIKQGFAEVFEKDADSVYSAFMQHFKDGNKSEEQVIPTQIIGKNQEFEWMLIYYKNQTKVLKNVVWDGGENVNAKKPGEKNAEAYVVNVSDEQTCKNYEFWIPTICGNVSLFKVTNAKVTCNIKVEQKEAKVGDSVTVDMSGSEFATAYEISVFPEGKQPNPIRLESGKKIWKTSFDTPGKYVFEATAFNKCGVASTNVCKDSIQVTKNIPPKCAIEVTPTEGCCGDNFTFDASKSSDVDGEVVRATFTFTDQESAESKPPDIKVGNPPLKLERVFDKPGKYRFFVKVMDNDGAEGNCNPIDFIVRDCKVQKRLYFLVEAGPMVAKGTYTGYIFARVGLTFLIVPEKLSFIASGGYAINLGCDFFKSHFLSNFLLNVHFKKFFVGGGFGFSSKVRNAVREDDKPRIEWKSNIDIVGNAGYQIFKAFNKKGYIFGEIRIPIKKGLKFKYEHAFLLGFRLLF
jgi:hypothetical protein